MTLLEAYRKTVGYLGQRRRAYQLTFSSPAGEQVMQDLAKFCRADQSTFDADPRIHAVLEGRREVWLRIQNHLHLTADQLYTLFGGRSLNLTPETLSEDEDNG